MTFEQLFVDPRGGTSRRDFLPALAVVIAVTLFYALLVRGRTAQFCLLVLLYPAAVLHARRLHDMGRSVWLLALPLVVLLASMGIRLKYLSWSDPAAATLPDIALLLCAALALWCSFAGSRHVDK